MIQDKYNTARPLLNTGDIILFSGTGFVAKLIQFFDKAYYNHIGIIWEANGRLFILDANAPGVHPDYLSDRINSNKDFCIVRLQKDPQAIELALNQVMDKGQSGIKYNFARLPKIALFKSFGWNIKKLDGQGKDICSQFVQEFTNIFPIDCYQHNELMTPQDFIRQNNSEEAKVLFNDSIK